MSKPCKTSSPSAELPVQDRMLVCWMVSVSPSNTRLHITPVVFAVAPLLVAADLLLPVEATGPGTSLSISLSVASGTEALSGLQFDLQYDSSVISILATVGDAARAAAKSVYSNDLFPAQRRFLCVGLNGRLVPRGAHFNFLVNVSPNIPAGSYLLALANLLGTDAIGNTALLTGLSGGITVQGGSGSRIQASGVLNAASLVAGPVPLEELFRWWDSGLVPKLLRIPHHRLQVRC